MKFSVQVLLFFLLGTLVFTCTPKTTEEAQTSIPEREKVTVPKDLNKEPEFISPCKKFIDSEDPDASSTAHVLYRDFLKQNQFKEAYSWWKKAYTMAPAADGQRDYHFVDGGKIYYDMFTKTDDQALKAAYVDTIKILYDQAAECYSNNEMIYKGLLAFDMYYKYSNFISKKDNRMLFEEVLDKKGIKSPDFVVNPYTALLIDQFEAGEVDTAHAQKYAKLLLDIIEEGLENCKGKSCERWNIINSYAPVRLSEFERVRGFYDCAYYEEKYAAQLDMAEANCDDISTTFIRMKWGECNSEDSEVMKKIKDLYMEKCYTPPTPTTPKCATMLNEGDFKGACDCYTEKGRESSNAKYLYTAAKIYYAHLKNFAAARQMAREASEIEPNWGDPYLLVGKLYASSGPLCGPGTGFDSQRVTWVAIDEWNKAKRVDPSSTGEANKLIGKYRQYMPKKEDIFFRSINPGSSYTVPCWIQQSTTVRTSD